MIGVLLLQTAAILSAFDTEVKRAGVQEWRPWLYGQVQQESAWNCDAVSRVGATGCSQFMPGTWGDVAPSTDPSCAGIPPTNPPCAFRGQIAYMIQVRRWVGSWASEIDLIAASLAGYNGGAGWIRRERRQCEQDPRCSPSRWWGHVERHCIRSTANCRENREYPVRIFAYGDIEVPS